MELLNQPIEVSKSLSVWTDRLKLIATVIGILSPIIGLATYLGIKPEKLKVIEWEYISKSALVNPGSNSADIEILYKNQKIKQLVTITGRLANAGTIPIDSSDIKDEQFPSLTFPTHIIAAEIRSRSDDQIKASITLGPPESDNTSKNVVQIRNGLLNPGEYLGIQITLEGDPGEMVALPKLTSRILGGKPTTRYPAVREPIRNVAFFSMPPWIVVLILSFSSIAGGFLFVLSFLGFNEAFTRFPSAALRLASERTFRLIGENVSCEFARTSLSETLYVSLRPPQDKIIRQLINDLPVQGLTPAEFVSRALEEVRLEIRKLYFFGKFRIGTADFCLAILCNACSVGVILITASSWRFFLT